jgi:hypothetical protein
MLNLPDIITENIISFVLRSIALNPLEAKEYHFFSLEYANKMKETSNIDVVI